MSNVLVFSGTSEGRELSEFLSAEGILHEVFVATEYGKIVMEENPSCHISQGRLTESQMEELFFSKPGIVIDATHPYAVEVSKNIRQACENAGLRDKYVRIQRELPMTEKLLKEDYPEIEVVLSTEEAVSYLEKTTGNILLTTGVKTLSKYVAGKGLKDRLIARILPSRESLDIALSSGIAPHQIIAMEGPFGTAINEALIEQYQVKTIVTKNSGIKGGFIEKLEAAKNKNIKTLVIDLDKVAEGISVEESKKLIIRELSKEGIRASKNKNISIVGIGVGNNESMTVASLEAIKKAKLIIGAKRMVETGASINKTAMLVKEYEAEKVLEAVAEAEVSDIAILVSGDVSFYSGTESIKNILEENGYEPKALPGISSISYFASKISVPYSEGLLLSAHGKVLDLKKELNGKKKFFAILSGTEDLNNLIKEVQTLSVKGQVFVGYNLGLSDERITSLSIGQEAVFEDKGLYVMGVVFDD